MISPEKVIIIIALLFIICVMPFPIGLSLTLPPLSVIYLRCAKELEPDEAQKEN